MGVNQKEQACVKSLILHYNTLIIECYYSIIIHISNSSSDSKILNNLCCVYLNSTRIRYIKHATLISIIINEYTICESGVCCLIICKQNWSSPNGVIFHKSWVIYIDQGISCDLDTGILTCIVHIKSRLVQIHT